MNRKLSVRERVYGYVKKKPYFGQKCLSCGMKLTCNGCSRCGKCGSTGPAD